MTHWKAGMRAEISSGLGGIFEVKLIERRADARWHVRVDMPLNPDFHRIKLTPLETDLQDVAHP